MNARPVTWQRLQCLQRTRCHHRGCRRHRRGLCGTQRRCLRGVSERESLRHAPSNEISKRAHLGYPAIERGPLAEHRDIVRCLVM
jgi:hypothetical protein